MSLHLVDLLFLKELSVSHEALQETELNILQVVHSYSDDTHCINKVMILNARKSTVKYDEPKQRTGRVEETSYLAQSSSAALAI